VEHVAADYAATCSTVGRTVSVERGGEPTADRLLVGRAEAVDDQGRLVVRPATGPSLAIAAGDVTHVRPVAGDGSPGPDH
jgi:BirA family biotin operon repressor/biotin-[acetyl-CoA-carboxylase] ligase